MLNKEPAYNISRLEAKINLNSLSEVRYTDLSEQLFDKRWYKYREEQLINRRKEIIKSAEEQAIKQIQNNSLFITDVSVPIAKSSHSLLSLDINKAAPQRIFSGRIKH